METSWKKFIGHIKSFEGKPINIIELLFEFPTANILWNVVAGEKLDYHDSHYSELSRMISNLNLKVCQNVSKSTQSKPNELNRRVLTDLNIYFFN